MVSTMRAPANLFTMSAHSVMVYETAYDADTRLFRGERIHNKPVSEN